jgi:hypothetical protein
LSAFKNECSPNIGTPPAIVYDDAVAAQSEQKDVPIPCDWIGTAKGLVNAE